MGEGWREEMMENGEGKERGGGRCRKWGMGLCLMIRGCQNQGGLGGENEMRWVIISSV